MFHCASENEFWKYDLNSEHIMLGAYFVKQSPETWPIEV